MVEVLVSTSAGAMLPGWSGQGGAGGLPPASRGHRAAWRKGGARGGSGTRPPSVARTVHTSARVSAREFRARMREGFSFVHRGLRCVRYVFLLVIALRIY